MGCYGEELRRAVHAQPATGEAAAATAVALPAKDIHTGDRVVCTMAGRTRIQLQVLGNSAAEADQYHTLSQLQEQLLQQVQLHFQQKTCRLAAPAWLWTVCMK